MARVVGITNGQAVIAFRDDELRGVAGVQTVALEGSAANRILIRLGAAGAKYLNDRYNLPGDLRSSTGELPEAVVKAIAEAIPLAAKWIRYEGEDADQAVYSGDLARALGDDPVSVNLKYKAPARSRRESDPPI